MSVMPTLPLLKRVPPAVWIVLAWGLSIAYSMLAAARQPGSSGPLGADAVGHRDWALIAAASVIVVAAAVLLLKRPLISVTLLTIVTFAVTGATNAWTQLPLTALPAVGVALYFVTATQPARTSRWALAIVLITLLTHLGQTSHNALGLTTSTDDGAPATGTLFHVGEYQVTTNLPQLGTSDKGLLLAIIAWLAGRSVRRSREHAEALSVQVARQEVLAERLRIAREMHDTVAHSISIIALQAGAARRVMDNRPDRARQALTEIENAGRETLSGLRRILGTLRSAEGERTMPENAPPAPPGLDDLSRLAAATTAAGVQVDLRWEGERRPLPASIDLAALRICQESIANVVRHAGADSCAVTVDYREKGEVSVEITDSGRGHGTASSTGFGLAGLRERVALLHGEFQAGPRSGGGFQVSARLPVPDRSR